MDAAHNRWNFGKPKMLRGPPAPLAGNQLKIIIIHYSYKYWLNDAFFFYGPGQLLNFLRRKIKTRLEAAGSYLRQSYHLYPLFYPLRFRRYQRIKPFTQDFSFHIISFISYLFTISYDKLNSRNSLASSLYFLAPSECSSYRKIGFPKPGASLRRIFRGITVL